MIRKLLPCPVCSGESFIESVTQGGLICSDCGAVSNQVEVADDEDDPATRPAFVRPHTYTHVTEEESKAKREARVLLKLRDERNVDQILEGLQTILIHMAQSLVSKGCCSDLAVLTIREAWFTFLTRSALLSPSPGLLERRFEFGKVDCVIDKWGIPDRKGQTKVVTAQMPSERRKQWSGLLLLMEERNLSIDNMVVVVDASSIIYAHDWLCLFLRVEVFPLPDTVLVALLPTDKESPVLSMGYEELCSFVQTIINPDSSISLTSGERKSAVRRLFYKILLCERLRREYLGSKNLPVSETLMEDLPRIDLASLLAILIIGIRNAGGGAVPAHILNWIARGDLPYFSAHKILPQSLDRIEYYWLSDAQNAYMRPAFCPDTAPSLEDLTNLVERITNVVGVPCKSNDALGLLSTAANMLGLGDDFASFILKLAKTNLFGMMMDGDTVFSGHPVVNRKRWDTEEIKYDPFDADPEQFFLSDLSVEEYVAITILFGMKLVFPDLHRYNSSSENNCDGDENGIDKSFELFSGLDMQYSIAYKRDVCRSRLKFGSLEFWDTLSDEEREVLLTFVANERLVELRPCLIEDLRSAVAETVCEKKVGQLGDSASNTIRSGKLSKYVLSPPTLDMEGSLFAHLICDVLRACGIVDEEKNVYRIYQALREYEKRILASSFKFS